MKKMLFGFLILALAVSAPAFARGSNPTLPAPTGVVASYDCDFTVDASWDELSGAKKYSVEVTAEYDSGLILCLTGPTLTFPSVPCFNGVPICTPDTTIVFSFGTFTNSITIDGSNFLVDFGNGPVPPCTIDSVRVKGLNPPQRHGSQNNPFSDPATPDNNCF